MCGITGVIKFDSTVVDTSKLEEMTRCLAHRGPDNQGVYINSESSIAFGHRRLSIIDLNERASQPFHFNHLSITYNGEIYNYIEIRKELIKLGYVFQTDSDTEVLLKSYAAWGSNCLEKLDGMFAFAINDEENKEVFLARDRFGEKPLYYSIGKNDFVFASEIKAIATYKSKLEINEKAVYRYLVFDIVENPADLSETFFTGINKLEAAHFIKIQSSGTFSKVKYWDINPSKKFTGTEKNAVDKFKVLFETSVKRRLRSDVSIGTSLSGGLDSSSIVASINNLGNGNDMNTFTARFQDKRYDEGDFVDILEKTNKFKRNDVYPSLEGLVEQLDLLFYHQEEPFGSSSIFAQWEVMKKAKEKEVKVLLDGQGADEILGGYPKYFQQVLRTLLWKHPSQFLRLKKQLKNEMNFNLNFKGLIQMAAPSLFDLLKNNNLLSRQRSNLEADLSSEFVIRNASIKNPFQSHKTLNQVLYFDTFKYGLNKLLRFSDKNAMAFSREVRLPFLSHELVEFIFSLPEDMKINLPWTKYILRKSMKDTLPKDICWRKDKKGFSPPQQSWMKSALFQNLHNESFNFLKQKGLLQSEYHIDQWAIIMTAQLYRFTERF